MILLVDHQDSFTRNLEHQLSFLDEVLVQDRRKITEKSIEAAQLIVLSPGPGKPRDYPETIEIVSKLREQVPILGICLGFQMLMEMDGASIIRQSQVLHGVCTEISTDTESIIYQGFSSTIRVARYHSLQLDPKSLSKLPSSVRITSHDSIRQVPMSFEDATRKLFGLQYHPESFLTENGNKLIENIRNACMDEIG